MAKTLQYFMWGYQLHFIHSFESRVKEALKELCANVETQCLLVGVSASGNKTPIVCIAPEDEVFSPHHFQECYSNSQNIYKKHPDHNIFFGDAPSMNDKSENILKKSIREAVSDSLVNYNEELSAQSFCGYAVNVDGYYVVPVIFASTDDLEKIPSIPEPIVFDRWSSNQNIVESLIHCLLDEASEGLKEKEPGRFIGEYSNFSKEELLKQSAKSFCGAISMSINDGILQGVFDSINKASSLRYEGEASKGAIIFAPPQSEALNYEVVFKQPTRLNQFKLIRKLIEISDENLSCFCESDQGIAGLSSITSEKPLPMFTAVFNEHHSWALEYGGIKLFNCQFGVPSLPQLRLSPSSFISNCRRVLRGMTLEQSQGLWAIVSSAMEQKHGTMLVISERAQQEVERLQNQSIEIDPVSLTPSIMSKVSNIDGAIVVDQNCRCYGIGVILDGMACNEGDPSRGARYNSAVKYIRSSDASTLCIVVSEDGYVDMLPQLRPQMSQQQLEQYVEELKTKNFENCHKTRNWLNKYRFYLNKEQCHIVNRELNRIDSDPDARTAIRVKYPIFKPNPEMNESYFSDYDL